MYQITRKNRIKEQLQLCHANGDVALQVEVDINVDQMGARIKKAYDALGEAQNKLKDGQDAEALEAYGKAVCLLLETVFGPENAAKIVEFYEASYSELLLDLCPFLQDEILPKVREASAARKEQLLAMARR